MISAIGYLLVAIGVVSLFIDNDWFSDIIDLGLIFAGLTIAMLGCGR